MRKKKYKKVCEGRFDVRETCVHLAKDARASSKMSSEKHMNQRKVVSVQWPAILAMALSIYAGDAGTWGYNNQRNRFTNELGFTTLTQVWKYTTAPFEGNIVPFYASPAVADGIVVVCDMRGRIFAFDAAASFSASNPILLWQKALVNTSIMGAPLISKGKVFICDREGRVRCFRLRDGTALWTVDIRSNIDSSPIVVGNTLFVTVGIPINGLVGIKISDTQGEILWTYSTNQPSYSSPAYYEDATNKLVYFGNNEGKFFCLDVAASIDTTISPTLKWQKTYSAGFSRSSPMVVGSKVVAIPGQSNLTVNVMSAVTGANLFTGSIPGPSILNINSSMATDGTNVYFVGGQTTQRLYVLNLSVSPTINEIHSSLADQGGLDFAASPSLTTQALIGATARNQATNESGRLFHVQNSVFTFKALDGEAYSSPTIANGVVYVCTTAGSVYAFRGTNTPPPSVTQSSPSGGANIQTDTALITWTPVNDAEDGANVTYVFRYDDDGEVLEDFIGETVLLVGQNSIELTGLVPNTRYYYSIRTKDQSGAYSQWSAVQNFWYKKVVEPPSPPSDIIALPYDGSVTLNWTQSPSPDVAGYRVRWGPVGAASNIVNLGVTTTTTIGGLTNGITYEFALSAVDTDGFESSQISTTATPNPLISINGVAYATLAQALASASPGDTILLGPGLFTPSASGLTSAFEFNQGISINGFSALHTKIAGLSAFNVIKVNQSGSPIASTISNVLIYDGTNGVYVNGAALTIKNCVIYGTTNGINIPVQSNVQIINDTICYCSESGIVSGNSTIHLRNNIIVQNKYGVSNFSNTVSGNNNNMLNILANWINPVMLAGDIIANVNFLDVANLDFREEVGSPTVDAGNPADPYDKEPAPNGFRVNMGAFGNTFLATKSTSTPPAAVVTTGKSDGGGCYVATSTIGKYGFAYVEPYHAVKGVVESITGNAFMRSYYAVSPSFGRVLKKRPVVNRLITDLLMKRR